MDIIKTCPTSSKYMLSKVFLNCSAGFSFPLLSRQILKKSNFRFSGTSVIPERMTDISRFSFVIAISIGSVSFLSQIAAGSTLWMKIVEIIYLTAKEFLLIIPKEISKRNWRHPNLRRAATKSSLPSDTANCRRVPFSRTLVLFTLKKWKAGWLTNM